MDKKRFSTWYVLAAVLVLIALQPVLPGAGKAIAASVGKQYVPGRLDTRGVDRVLTPEKAAEVKRYGAGERPLVACLELVKTGTTSLRQHETVNEHGLDASREPLPRSDESDARPRAGETRT